MRVCGMFYTILFQTAWVWIARAQTINFLRLRILLKQKLIICVVREIIIRVRELSFTRSHCFHIMRMVKMSHVCHWSHNKRGHPSICPTTTRTGGGRGNKIQNELQSLCLYLVYYGKHIPAHNLLLILHLYCQV